MLALFGLAKSFLFIHSTFLKYTKMFYYSQLNSWRIELVLNFLKRTDLPEILHLKRFLACNLKKFTMFLQSTCKLTLMRYHLTTNIVLQIKEH